MRKASIRELRLTLLPSLPSARRLSLSTRISGGRNGKIVYRLKDQGAELLPIVERLTESMRFSGRPNIVKSYWECTLDPKRVKKGRQAYFEFTVTDYCGNETKYSVKGFYLVNY